MTPANDPRDDASAPIAAIDVWTSTTRLLVAAEETGLEAARVRLSLAGAAVLEAVRRSFDLDALEVSRAGLREGLVLEAVG